MSGKTKSKPAIKRMVAKESTDPKKPGFIVHIYFDDKEQTELESPLYSTEGETEAATKKFQETGKFPKPEKKPRVQLVDRAGITGTQSPDPMGSRFPFGKGDQKQQESVSKESEIGNTFSAAAPLMVFKNPATGDHAFFYNGGTTKRYPKGYFLRSHQELLSAKPDIEKDGGSAFECPYWGAEKIRAYMEEQGYKLIHG